MTITGNNSNNTAAGSTTGGESETAGGESASAGRRSNYVGVVETIFEEEEEETDESYDDDDYEEEELLNQQQKQQCYSISSPAYSSPPLSPPFSNASTPDLLSTLRDWTLASRRKPDVKIHVQGECFHLHKDVMTSKSAYLKRHLAEVTEFNLDPKLKITSETFKLIAQHCYNSDHILITPFNLAALRTASEILQLNNADNNHDDDDHCLRRKTESYFCLVVLSNKEFLSIVLQSSLLLLPEAEEMVFVTSRCIEALWGLESVGREWRFLGDGIKGMKPQDFGLVLESMKTRITRRSHDLLYRLVDLYFEVYTGKISEEQKSQVCNSIDCSMLSSQLLVHAVQNSKMPLRFILQAMLIEQLNTQRTIFSAMATTTRHGHPPPHQQPQQDHTTEAETLGSLLQKDTAQRQVAKLKSTIDDTSSRIQSLEKELSGMRKRLQETERRSNVLAFDQDRSISCRFSGYKDDQTKNHDDHSDNNKVGKGDRGSKSLSFLRFGSKEKRSAGLEEDGPTPRMRKSLGQRFIMGLKTAFGVSSSSSGRPSSNNKEESKLVVDGSSKRGVGGCKDDDNCKYNVGDDFIVKGTLPWAGDGGRMKERFPSHTRTSSLGN